MSDKVKTFGLKLPAAVYAKLYVVITAQKLPRAEYISRAVKMTTDPKWCLVYLPKVTIILIATGYTIYIYI